MCSIEPQNLENFCVKSVFSATRSHTFAVFHTMSSSSLLHCHSFSLRLCTFHTILWSLHPSTLSCVSHTHTHSEAVPLKRVSRLESEWPAEVQQPAVVAPSPELCYLFFSALKACSSNAFNISIHVQQRRWSKGAGAGMRMCVCVCARHVLCCSFLLFLVLFQGAVSC